MSSVLEAVSDLAFAANKLADRANVFREEPASRLSKLARTVKSLPDGAGLDATVPPQYKAIWLVAKSGATASLDSRTLRFLCWDPDVATDPTFHLYLARSTAVLGSQPILGLVRSLHKRWRSIRQDDSVRSSVEQAVGSYAGPNSTLQLWQREKKKILLSDAAQTMGTVVLENRLPLAEAWQQWRIDADSEFASEVVGYAANQIRKHLRVEPRGWDFAIEHLLAFDFPDVADFKREVADFVVAATTAEETVRERLRAFVLEHRNLGHPRLKRNNWAGIHQAVQDVVVRWCTTADIRLFFEHAMPRSGDRHDRRKFWLPYVSTISQSRAFLTDEVRSDIRLKKVDVSASGLTKSPHSAFVLDFGSVVVVEFAEVGACYVYTAKDFQTLVCDLWTSRPLSDATLKDKSRAVHRQRHIGQWQDDIREFLAEHGIRPDANRRK